jgi:hypothetical protein
MSPLTALDNDSVLHPEPHPADCWCVVILTGITRAMRLETQYEESGTNEFLTIRTDLDGLERAHGQDSSHDSARVGHVSELG